jgi:hypothetical protein
VWKGQHLGWDLDQVIEQAIADSQGDLSLAESQNILRDVFRSTQDYHVNFAFSSTESALLNFTVKGAEGRYFIAHIDREKLSETAFPFQVGDELIKFGGQPVEEAIEQIKTETSQGVAPTDQALAELFLTRRFRANGMTVPRDQTVMLTFATKSSNFDKQTDFQLHWRYTPEAVTSMSENTPSSWLSSTSVPSFQTQIEGVQMLGGPSLLRSNLVNEGEEPKNEPNPRGVGTKKSYIPALGPKIWESAEDSKFHAYIFRSEGGKIVGYIRIPHYGGNHEWVEEFVTVMKRFEETTDSLVTDQINNPGGSVFYLYALVSALTDTAVHTPLHHLKITSADVKTAHGILEALKFVRNDEESQSVLGQNWGGYPVTYQTTEFIRHWAHFVIAEWNAGSTLTRPTHIYGVDKINPHKDVNYTKPILLLVNSLDFSGGDFFPAILQDNKRAKIFGTRTAGAGGYVLGTAYPNALGLEYFSYTGSLAKRVNDQPIESLGVTPDINYELTVKDLTDSYGHLKTLVADSNLASPLGKPGIARICYCF